MKAIPDFPFDLRSRDPDSFDRERLLDFPIKEVINVIVPSEFLVLPADASFRVEYISHEAESGVLDRARTSGMNFRLPIFPVCVTEPATVPQGGTTMVIASGLLPSRAVHLFLGDTEVGAGQSDADGNATLSMTIPLDAKTGERLVTLGALAVSADCSVTVVDQELDSQTFSLLKSYEDLLKGQQRLTEIMGLILHELVANREVPKEDALKLTDNYQQFVQQQAELIQRFEEIVRDVMR